MRRKQRIWDEKHALELLSRVPSVELATSTPEGAPVLRSLNGAVSGDWIYFHGAIAGEKSSCLGRPAVVQAKETIAQIPSHFVDPERACPATTYFRAVQAKGTLVDITDMKEKGRALDALMQKLQPEGGYRSFASGAEFYAKNLKATRVFGMPLEELTAKRSLGQEKPKDFVQKIVLGLFGRGQGRDLEAIEEILEASPDARPWTHRVRDEELSLHLFPTQQQICAHASLLRDEYWREGIPTQEIESSLRESNAWVGAVSAEGQLVGAARATSDRHWCASIFDVVVDKRSRGAGLGKALMQLLLSHPLVRDCRVQRLGTMDAVPFYESLGFVPAADAPRNFVSHPLVRQARIAEPLNNAQSL